MPIIETNMDRHINFEDNIFILNVRIRMISDLLCLDTDTDLFLEKTLDDINFADRVLSALTQNLTGNSMLLDREEELSKLADLEWRFDQLITGIHGTTGISGALNLGENRERLLLYRNNSAQRRGIIEDSRSPENQNESEPVVSSYEMNQLLQGL